MTTTFYVTIEQERRTKSPEGWSLPQVKFLQYTVTLHRRAGEDAGRLEQRARVQAWDRAGEAKLWGSEVVSVSVHVQALRSAPREV